MSGKGLVTPGPTMKARSKVAVEDPQLQAALSNLDLRLFTAGVVQAEHPEWKDRVAEIRRETLADLDGWIDKLEAKLLSLGVVVHRAATPEEARAYILGLAQREGVRRVVKSKSMATEEIDLGSALEAVGIESIETDLGEYIVQLADERPSHMITPAIHKTLGQIADVLSKEAGTELPVVREPLTAWARDKLREKFVAADMGITGANFVAADTGTIVVVTNEGNGRFCTSLPRIHVAVVPVEKVVPRFEDLGVLLPTLVMSATGAKMSNYLSMVTGPRREGEIDGPEQLHVVLLDHNRRVLLGTPYEDMLGCIRCGACLNVCPVYRTVGGHAYDSSYSGPMGKILTPLVTGGEEGRDLPFASTLCGACTEACPAEIPLADLLVRLRADLRTPGPVVVPGAQKPAPPPALPVGPVGHSDEHPRKPGEGFATAVTRITVPTRRAPWSQRRMGFDAWSRLWAHPSAYRASLRVGRLGAKALRPRAGWVQRAPLLRAWTDTRDVLVPSGPTFRERWAARERGEERW
ncbi:MAG: iron-sulfur cluster-binding protein [Actinomycetia bacterium]|nr:iron-sulfur cluster-binding protein [Actinomycetes bacterium]